MSIKDEINKAIQQTKEIAEKEGLLKDLEPLEKADTTLLDNTVSLFCHQPLFTLTAEEVETIKLMAYLSLTFLDIRVHYHLNTEEQCKEDADRINNILTRIKQWQDENKTN